MREKPNLAAMPRAEDMVIPIKAHHCSGCGAGKQENASRGEIFCLDFPFIEHFDPAPRNLGVTGDTAATSDGMRQGVCV